MTDKIHVVIVDDHPLFRQGVAQTLGGAPDIEIMAEGGSADEAIRLASDLLPDILLLDIDIPGDRSRVPTGAINQPAVLIRPIHSGSPQRLEV